MKHSQAVVQGWIETCQEQMSRLTQWEQEFIDSIAERLELDGSISPRQEEVLERIYAEKTR